MNSQKEYTNVDPTLLAKSNKRAQFLSSIAKNVSGKTESSENTSTEPSVQHAFYATIMVHQQLLYSADCLKHTPRTVAVLIQDLLNLVKAQRSTVALSVITVETSSKQNASLLTHLIVPKSDESVLKIILSDDNLRQICTSKRRTRRKKRRESAKDSVEALVGLANSNLWQSSDDLEGQRLLILLVNETNFMHERPAVLKQLDTMHTGQAEKRQLQVVIVTTDEKNKKLVGATASDDVSMMHCSSKETIKCQPTLLQIFTNVTVAQDTIPTIKYRYVKTEVSEEDKNILIIVIILFGIFSLINYNLILIVMHSRRKGRLLILDHWCSCVFGHRRRRVKCKPVSDSPVPAADGDLSQQAAESQRQPSQREINSEAIGESASADTDTATTVKKHTPSNQPTTAIMREMEIFIESVKQKALAEKKAAARKKKREKKKARLAQIAASLPKSPPHVKTPPRSKTPPRTKTPPRALPITEVDSGSTTPAL